MSRSSGKNGIVTGTRSITLLGGRFGGRGRRVHENPKNERDRGLFIEKTPLSTLSQTVALTLF